MMYLTVTRREIKIWMATLMFSHNYLVNNTLALVCSWILQDLHGDNVNDGKLSPSYFAVFKLEFSYLSWNSTGEIGRIGRHRAETHRYFNIRGFGQMSPDASDFPGGIPALWLVSLPVC